MRRKGGPDVLQREQDAGAMTTLFSLHLRPVPKGRPRLGNGHAYTPERTRVYEQQVAWAYKQAGGTLHEGPLAVTMVFRAKTWPGDLDNLVKAVLDALNGIAWRDDRQIRELHAALETGVLVEGVDVRIDERSA